VSGKIGPLGRPKAGLRPSLRHTTRTVPQLSHEHWYRNREGVSFSRAESSWTDSVGNTLPINNSNYFRIPRGRLIFSGNALAPNLSYLLNIDYNSVTSQPIGFRAFWLSYRFSDAFELYVGQSKVPGSRVPAIQWRVGDRLGRPFHGDPPPNRGHIGVFARRPRDRGGSLWVRRLH